MKSALKTTVEITKQHFVPLFASALFALATAATPTTLYSQVSHLAAASQSGASTADKQSSLSGLAKLDVLPAAGRSYISGSIGSDLPAYHVESQKNGFHAASRGLASDFTARGVEISNDSVHIRLALDSFGHGEGLNKVSSASADRVGTNRVEYHHAGLTEWYVNGPLGLEQGFTVDRSEKNSSGLLTVALAMEGNITATLEEGGMGVTLSNPKSKSQFEYAGLVSTDADGKELPSRLEVAGNRLLIKVNDSGARYPVTIDPWLYTKTFASFGSYYDAGVSVAVDAIYGNHDYVVVVGAMNAKRTSSSPASGLAYVYESHNCCSSLTTWRKITLYPSDGVAGDGFGQSVAIDNNPYSSWNGKTIIVGAPKHNSSAGKAYVFLKPASGWWGPANSSSAENAYMTGAGTAYFEFGFSVSISSNVAVVGEPQPINSNCSTCSYGQVYVFQPITWSGLVTAAGVLSLPSNPGNGSEFGFSVSISSSGGGDYPGVVLVGMPQLPGYGGCNCGPGSAYIYNEPNNNVWTSTSTPDYTLSSPYTTNDWFGFSVSLALGEWAVVGAPNATCPTQSGQCPSGYPANTGLAYQFNGNSGWAPAVTMYPSDGKTADLFGFSVATDGKAAPEVVVGSVHHSNGSRQGKGYFFPGLWSQTGFSPETQSVAPTGSNAEFGWSVASFQSASVGVAVFGAPESNSYSGAAYLYVY